jgi:predicted dienelactone hydrolase
MNPRKLFVMLLIAVLVVPALAIHTSVGAQGGAPAQGLRPDAPPYALHGPYWVGMIGMDAETDFHPTQIQVWFPARDPAGEPESITYWASPTGELPIFGHALFDAEPDSVGGPFPLVIFAHGLGGGNGGNAYLCEHLASEGFIVMAINYADSGDATVPADPAMSIFTRPKDVSWQIDYAEQLNADESSKLHGLIDMERIAIVGHSYGGYTALVAGGALVDLTGPTSWCLEYPELPLPAEVGGGTLQERFCDRAAQVAELAGLPNVPEGLWPSWADPRIDAIVSLAPWTPFFGAESANTITIPTLVMFGSKDRIVDTESDRYQPYAYDNLGATTKALVVFEDGAHMLFAYGCNSMPWLADFGMYWACSDPVWDMDRAHDLINHFTTAFLLAELKGDKDAAAALAPDVVSFPGIAYETTGF